MELPVERLARKPFGLELEAAGDADEGLLEIGEEVVGELGGVLGVGFSEFPDGAGAGGGEGGAW